MYRKTYKVKGRDVNDFMAMQDFAYYLYSIDTMHAFLFQMGYTKKKIAVLELNLEPIWQKLHHYKTLFFTQEFSANLEFTDLDNKGVLHAKCRFFTIQNELCATIDSSFYLKKSFRKLISKQISFGNIKISESKLGPNML